MDSQVARSSIISNKRGFCCSSVKSPPLCICLSRFTHYPFYLFCFFARSAAWFSKKKEKKTFRLWKRLKATNFMNVVLVDSSFQNKATVCVKWSKPRNPESNSFQRWESRYIFVRLSGAECFFSHVFSSFVEWGLLWRYKSLAVRAYPGATRRENEIQSSGRGLYLNRPSVLCS